MDYLELADKFTSGLRWMYRNECLNPVDINRIPRWYPGSWKEWIEDITTFGLLYPKEWAQVQEEYITLAQRRYQRINQCTELKFERTDDGYLRKIGEQDVFLRIRFENTTLSVVELAHKIECESILGFEDYLAYCGTSEDLKKGHLRTIESRIVDRILTVASDGAELLYDVRFVQDCSDSLFDGNEIYVDALNQTYHVL